MGAGKLDWRTALRERPLGLGCSALGNLYTAIDDGAARATVDCAWEAGMRLFDTAPYYGLGLAERRLGDALRERGRDECVLSTKVGRLLRPEDSPPPGAVRHGFATPMPFAVEYDYGYDGVMRSFEASLQRLGLSRIDILLVHDLGEETHGERHASHFADFANGGYRALEELRRSGAIQAVGLGANETAILDQAMGVGDFDCFLLAGRYTLLEQYPLDGFFDRVAKHGAVIIAGGVYNSGILAVGTRGSDTPHFNYEPAPESVVDRVRRIEAVCERFDVPMAVAALQFPLAHPVVAAELVGLGSPEQVERTRQLAAIRIPGEFWAALREERILRPDAPLPATVSTGLTA